MASAAAASDVTDGPVLILINKRIRNLRKKLNRIAQLEESISQGKSVIKNKEQEELLKSKPAIVAAVDELEKFRQPLSVAVDEEMNLAMQQRQVEASENNGKEVDGDNVDKTLNNEENESALKSELDVQDLLSLIYFGSMFDVNSQSDFSSIMLTRTHERKCCLTYDYITDDAAALMLEERDLDLISMMRSLLISRPMDSSFSHQNALQRCIEHAKLWLAKSEKPIDSTSDVTYAALREKLAKIVGSDYSRITPEMKATADVAAEAAGNYGFQVPLQVESSVAQHDQKEDNVTNLQRNETGEDQSNLVEAPLKHDAEATEKSVDIPVETHPNGADSKEQFVPRRNYHNQRGGGWNGNGGGGGGRRGGYGNGRGGRSGGRGGPYQNGGRSNNLYNEQSGNYYPRNYHGGGRGRGGGRGGGGGHYSNGGNHHAPPGVEVAES